MINSQQTKTLYQFLQDLDDREKEGFTDGSEENLFQLVKSLAEVLYEELNKDEHGKKRYKIPS